MKLVNPGDYADILGSTFVRHERAAILQIGRRTWDRWTLGRLGCPHPKAAAALNRVLREMRIVSLAGLAKHAQEIGNYKGLGVTAYFLVLAILKDGGYEVRDVHPEHVTYFTVKARAQKAAAKSRPRKPRRAGPPSESASASVH